MTLMTRKMDTLLEETRIARHRLPLPLSNFVQYSAMLVRRHPEDFQSRADLEQYIRTLTDLISTKVNSR